MVDETSDTMDIPERVAGITTPKEPSGGVGIEQSILARPEGFIVASPQLENGHTRIANELLEHFCSLSISGGEFRILLFVIRKTYGFQKKIDHISLSQFEGGTKMSRSHVCLAIKNLVLKQVLVKEKNGYKLNKNYESWVVLAKVPPVLRLGTPSTKASTKSSTKASTHKRNKETNTKEITSSADGADNNTLIVEILKAFEEVDPKNKTYYGNKTQRKAADFLVTEYGLERVKKAIAMLPAINSQKLYIAQITTPYELQQNWIKLGNALRKNLPTNAPKWKVWN